MNAIPEHRMTVDEFLEWAKAQPGRYELFDGRIVAMSPERVGHAEAKGRVYRALGDAISKSQLPCTVLPDGATVRVDARTTYEPDSLVYCGQKLDDDAIEVPNPIIIVEVLSPSTQYIDLGAKLAGYFQIPSVVHYLLVTPGNAPIIHHQRQADGNILTRLAHADPVTLDPPGLTFDPPGLTFDVADVLPA
ncbi:MAG: Uma2 family endonuclease [Hyphomicrobiaceae bacterium]